MAKTSYCPELVETICAAIAEHGLDQPGWEAGGISRGTFYLWQKQYPEFKEATEEAKQEFARSRPPEQKRQAWRNIADYLWEGLVITWETSGETVRNIEDPDGTVKAVIRETFKKKHIERRPCPSWVLDRVLGKNTAILDALQILLTEGIATEEQARIVAEGVARVERELKQQEAKKATQNDS